MRAFDKAGALVAEAKLALPEATSVRVRDVAVASNGDFVAAASAQNASGALSSVIAWVDSRGRLIRAVRTSPFAAMRIAFASDGTLWAAGRVHDEEFNSVPNHNLIRVYDPQGRLIKSLLPSGSFAAGRQHPAAEAFLVSGKDRVGFYSAPASEWVEMSLSGELLGRWKTAIPEEGTWLMGVALTSSGDVYLGGFNRTSPPSGNENDRPPSSVLYRLNKSDGSLSRVDALPFVGARKDVLLLAAEGQQLVYCRKSPRTLDWVLAPRN
ncbi:MAG: hypothetical protein HXY18_00065 [Bryobacteraceae bacterium]|nr:hypothetical protein [Bryobacteraceae bacterium]